MLVTLEVIVCKYNYFQDDFRKVTFSIIEPSLMGKVRAGKFGVSQNLPQFAGSFSTLIYASGEV